MIQFINESLKLVSMNSVAGNGNEEIALYCQQLMNRVGFKTSLQSVTHSQEGVSKRQFNVVGILGDPLVDSRTKKGLLLTTHLDTTTPGISGHWTETKGDPFLATIKGEKIYGLGAADAKLDFLCKLKACEQYKDKKLKMPLYLAGTAGSELGLIGSRFLIKSMALNPKYVLVGEPTELCSVSRHKAYALYQVSISYNQLERDAKGFNTRIEIQCYGKSSDGTTPHLGDNAIQRSLEVIGRIKTGNFQLRPSKIDGGDIANKVPDRSKIEFYIQNSCFDDFKKFYRDQLSSESQSNLQIEFGGLGETGVKFLPEAILEAIQSLQLFITGLKIESKESEDQNFDPPHSTVNFCRVSQKPGGVDLLFDIKLLPGTQIESFDQTLKQGVQQLNAAYPSLMMKVSRQRYNPGLELQNNELSRVSREVQLGLGIAEGAVKQSMGAETAQFVAAGYEAIAFGPGQSVGNGHSPNEFNTVEQLDNAVHFYSRLIERFCI